jgi:deazaflavin-dependent oxidoreductase (nitroreductase family)
MLRGREHVERYEATDGREGHDWQGSQALILTTTGRKSGEERKTPLIYGRDGERYLIVASMGGAPKPPAWYLNLEANPAATIQVWGERIAVRAEDADAEQKPRLWKTMTDVWPAYDEYQAKTERPIPVVILEPTG